MNRVYFPAGIAVPQQPFEVRPLTDVQAREIIRINYCMLRPLLDVAVYTNLHVGMICYLRAMLIHKGLVSNQFAVATYFVKYNECKAITNANRDLLYNANPLIDDAFIDALIPLVNRQYLAKHFTDLLCMTAYVFRVRGHHYLADYEKLFDKLWLNMRYVKLDLGLPWVAITRYAFHSVFPVHLDRFW